MNEKLKFGLSFFVCAGLLGFVWVKAGFPFGSVIFLVWLIASVLSLTLLFGTFEYTLRNLYRLAGVMILSTAILIGISSANQDIFSKGSLITLFDRWGESGIICVGAAILILIGGIDLSIGSMVALCAVGTCVLMEEGVHPLLAIPAVLLVGFIFGAAQGLLVTQMRLQSFLVTLCGMFIFRGFAKSLGKGEKGFLTAVNSFSDSPGTQELLKNLRFWLTGKDPMTERDLFPAKMVLFLVMAGVLALFLHRSVFGRYWCAIGYNEQAARYAGVNTWRHRVFIFAVCSFTAALAGVVLFMSTGSVRGSDAGVSWELYAITAAVLGGVSLRGGEGTAVGIVLGAMVLPFLERIMTAYVIPHEHIPWLIGLILLIGTIIDELIRRRSNVSK